MDFVIESENICDYLAMSDVIDYNNPIISENAEKLFSSYKDEVNKVESIFLFVRDKIKHSSEVTKQSKEIPLIVSCRASEVFLEKHGTCYSKSHLFAAFLRYFNIPTGFMYQGLINNENSKKIVLHAHNAVYLNSIKKWIRLDVRGNNKFLKSEFSTDKEFLPFKPNVEKCEFDSPIIYASPLEIITETLYKYETFDELKDNYPLANN